MSGTEPFDVRCGCRACPILELSLWALGLAISGDRLVYFLLQRHPPWPAPEGSRPNMRAAHLMGVPTWQYSMLSFLLCGAFVGLAGAIQVTSVYHRLMPNISSGYGFLGLLVAMLINYQAVWAAPVALFLRRTEHRQHQLPLQCSCNSVPLWACCRALVLFVLLGDGVRQRWLGGHRIGQHE